MLAVAVVWQSDDDLARTRVVKIFAGLVLDGVGVTGEAVDVALQLPVLTLQRVRLGLQIVQVVLLVAEGGQAVAAEDHMVAKEHGQDCHRDGSDATAIAVQTFTNA